MRAAGDKEDIGKLTDITDLQHILPNALWQYPGIKSSPFSSCHICQGG